MGLHFEHAAGDVEEVFLAFRVLDADLARLQCREQGCVPGRNTHFAHFCGRKHHGGFAGVNLTFGGYDIDVDCWHLR
jgi:hypothetical protein